MFDFPPSPSSGQVVSNPANGAAWQWDGAKWDALTLGMYLPLAGGTLTGPLILAGNATAQLGAIPLQQLNASLANYLPLGGGTMTGGLQLSGNAASNLQAVPYQQLQSYVTGQLAPYLTAAQAATTYLPLAGGTLTGSLSIAASTAAFTLNKGTGANANNIWGVMAGSARWNISLGDTTAESGSNAGSNFDIVRYSDAGASLGGVLNINRASGLATFGGGITTTGTVQGGALVSTGQVNVGTGIVYPQYSASNVFSMSWDNANTGCYLYLGSTSWGSLITSQPAGGYLIVFRLMPVAAGTQCYVWWQGGGAGYWSLSAPSDRRLKSNIKPATIDALGLINGLQVYEADIQGKWEHAPLQHWDCSLMADEVGDVIPHAHVHGSEETYDSILELPVIATMVRAMQQLSARVTKIEDPHEPDPDRSEPTRDHHAHAGAVEHGAARRHLSPMVTGQSGRRNPKRAAAKTDERPAKPTHPPATDPDEQ